MTAPFEKILVPVDFSIHSDEAVRMAADLSRRYRVPLTLLHVHEPLAPVIAHLEAKMARTRAAATDAGATEVETWIEEGAPFLRIIEAARAGHHDLIVMGTHGHTGVRHLLIGSVAERVVRMAHCPVLVVRARD
jgi:glycine betaine transporter